MEGLCDPDKIDELWQQSKAKRLWKISLPNSEAYRTSKESNLQPVLQGNAPREGDQAKSITSGEPDSPYSPEKLKNLQKYREYLNDITIRAEGGWPFPDTLPYDEKLLRYTLGLSSYSGSDSELEEIPTENQESPKRTHTFTQMNSDMNCQSRARQTPKKNHPQLARQGNPLSGDSQPDDGISVDDYMNRWNNRVETGTTFPNSPTPNTEASRPFLGSESDGLPFPNPRQLDFNSDKADYFSQDSTLTLVIRSTPQGRTVRWEELGHNRRSAGIPDPQINELPFQIGAPLALSEDEDPEDVEDLCREILIVRISELPDSEDDSAERVSLDDYNFDDFNEYLSDHIAPSPTATTEIKTSFNHDPPFAPPSVTVTVKLEDEQEEVDLYERRRILNPKRALRCKCATSHHQEHPSDSFDYS